jgi:glutamate racemase
MKVGVFDSGVGGLSVANAIKNAVPGVDVRLHQDKENLPYGSKTPNELVRLVEPFIKKFNEEHCRIIVIACNTVSTNILSNIREMTDAYLIGVEPMLAEASSYTESGVIAVCATPTTLISDRYSELKHQYAGHLEVIEPDCNDWAYMIEDSIIEQDKIDKEINLVLEKRADAIVLGCTHYHWIESEISKLAENRAKIFQPEQKIIAEVKLALKQLS